MAAMRALLAPCAVALVLIAGVASAEGMLRRSGTLRPQDARLARFAGLRSVLEHRPFSDLEGEFCLNRTQTFMALAHEYGIGMDDLPGFMASLCQIHLCHLNRTGTVFQVNTICGEVATIFENRALHKIGITEQTEDAARQYCRTLQNEVQEKFTLPPLFKEDFVCPLDAYEQERDERLKEAERRRKEESKVPSPVYKVTV